MLATAADKKTVTACARVPRHRAYAGNFEWADYRAENLFAHDADTGAVAHRDRSILRPRVSYGGAEIVDEDGVTLPRCGSIAFTLDALEKQIVGYDLPCMIESRTSDGLVEVLRSEEHTSELQSLMRISYAVFCWKKKKKKIK